MKKFLAASFLAGSFAVVNASNIAVSATATGVGGSDISAAGQGTWDDVSTIVDLNGTILDNKFAGALDKITGAIVGPNSFSQPLTINNNDTFTANFDIAGVTVASGFPVGFYIRFYDFNTGNIVASGPVQIGTLATPEPQTYALAAGAALIGFAAFRRARR